MKLSTPSAEKLLLEQALESMHQQCRFWINQLALRRDEKNFFSDLTTTKSLGLDTCPVGLARFIENTAVYSELQIPDSEEIHIAIVLGYGNEQPTVHERKTGNVIFL